MREPNSALSGVIRGKSERPNDLDARNAQVIREAIQYAPASGPVAPGLVGVWSESGYYVCAPCVGRIVARGCGHVLGRKQEQVWAGPDRAPIGVCVTCGDR